MRNIISLILVAGEPGQRADRARDEQQTISITRSQALDMLGQHRRDNDPRQIIVGERGVTDVAGKEDRLFTFSRDYQLAIGQMPRSQIGIDYDSVKLIR